MRYLLLFFTIFFLNLGNAQEVITKKVDIKNFEFYETYDDYVINNIMKPAVSAYVHRETSKYFTINKYLFTETDTKAKKAASAWCFKYENGIYLNMINAAWIGQWDTFVKFDIVGKKYMVILLNEDTDWRAIGHYSKYGGGLTEVLINASIKPKSSWKDKNDNKFKILFVDVENPMRADQIKKNEVFADLLDTKKVLELYNNDEAVVKKLKDNDFKVEDFIEFVTNANI
ncbi:hypothetical protein [Flavobacterium sp. GSP14]|uniref:hypothetical protein n=1 Tax=Flavobacterium sp. GSP14 TaxID=3401734 RepID=UPI003AAFE6CE